MTPPDDDIRVGSRQFPPIRRNAARVFAANGSDGKFDVVKFDKMRCGGFHCAIQPWLAFQIPSVKNNIDFAFFLTEKIRAAF
jgi:hypothetical protein